MALSQTSGEKMPTAGGFHRSNFGTIQNGDRFLFLYLLKELLGAISRPGMRPSIIFLRSFLVLTLGAVIVAQAQQPLNSEIKITKIEPAFVDSPKIQGGTYIKRPGAGRPVQWIEVEVTFDRIPSPKAVSKFAEELTFNYFILLKNQLSTTEKKPTMLTGSVTHVSIPDGKDLHSSIYISPRTIARMFDGKAPFTVAQAVVDAGVTVTGKEGLLAAFAWKTQVTKEGKGWWDNTMYSPTPGFLLNKNETPFAPLEWDFFEAIKPKTSN